MRLQETRLQETRKAATCPQLRESRLTEIYSTPCPKPRTLNPVVADTDHVSQLRRRDGPGELGAQPSKVSLPLHRTTVRVNLFFFFITLLELSDTKSLSA